MGGVLLGHESAGQRLDGLLAHVEGVGFVGGGGLRGGNFGGFHGGSCGGLVDGGGRLTALVGVGLDRFRQVHGSAFTCQGKHGAVVCVGLLIRFRLRRRLRACPDR